MVMYGELVRERDDDKHHIPLRNADISLLSSSSPHMFGYTGEPLFTFRRNDGVMYYIEHRALLIWTTSRLLHLMISTQHLSVQHIHIHYSFLSIQGMLQAMDKISGVDM